MLRIQFHMHNVQKSFLAQFGLEFITLEANVFYESKTCFIGKQAKTEKHTSTGSGNASKFSFLPRPLKLIIKTLDLVCLSHTEPECEND